MKELIKKLEKLAKTKCWRDRPDWHDDLYGETPDDAFDRGVTTGEVELARELLDIVIK